MLKNLLLTLAILLVFDVAVAKTTRNVVGKVVEFAGGQKGSGRQAWIIRAGGDGRREALRAGDRFCKGDRITTGPDTRFTVEFLIGGQAIVESGVDVEVSDPSTLEFTNKSLPRRARTLWDKLGKLDKDLEKLQIETAGGVIGIEG